MSARCRHRSPIGFGCGVTPTLVVLVAARFVQGIAAAVMMPASMALIGQA